MEKQTTMWIDGNKEKSVTVDYNVTDLDEAASLLGYVDYVDLYNANLPEDQEESPLNFRWTE